ncbi:MAG TPA: DUF3644 domain-containing protein [Phycisphaerae bacterium]|nr:DUF3644 domain-containing protein [Phycisphaerae bacterium]
MKREASLLLGKACDSLLLSIEFFNRPHDRGRTEAVLILLDHAFEMLLKASILRQGGRIRDKRARETIGFDACVRRGLSDGDIKFLSDEQALVLQTINGLRDAAQHHLLDVSEGQLYMHAQAGVTLFRDLLKAVFEQELRDCLPERVLPVSTSPPTDLTALFDSEIAEIKKLLGPHSRRGIEAQARLRPLAILDATIKGEKSQPSPSDLRKLGRDLSRAANWQQVFHGAAAVQLSATGNGPTLSLRLSKKQGIPVQLVPEGTPGASVVAVKRVDELGFYNLGLDQLAASVGLSAPKTTAVIRELDLQSDAECFKQITIGKSTFKRYSQKAIKRVLDALPQISIDDVWKKHRPRKRA